MAYEGVNQTGAGRCYKRTVNTVHSLSRGDQHAVFRYVGLCIIGFKQSQVRKERESGDRHTASRPRTLPTRSHASSELQERSDVDIATGILLARLILRLKAAELHQQQEIGRQVVVHPEGHLVVLLDEVGAHNARVAAGRFQNAPAIVDTELGIHEFVGELCEESVRVTRVAGPVVGVDEQAGGSDALADVVPPSDLKAHEVVLTAEIDRPAVVVTIGAGDARSPALLLEQSARGQIQRTHRIRDLGMKAGRLLRGRDLTQGVQRIEDADGGLEAAQVRGRVIDLREPIGIDIAQADRAQRSVGGGGVRAVAGTDTQQRHVIEDGVAAEQADIPARHHGTHVLVAERQEDLADVETGGTEGGMYGAAARLKIRTPAVVGADAGIETEGKPDVIPALRGRTAYRKRRRQQAIADGR